MAEDLFPDRDAGIILAADVETLGELRRIVQIGRTRPEVVAIKVGFSLAIPYGLRLVSRAVARLTSLPVIYDHQKAGTDIPKTGDLFARQCRWSGVKAVIIFPHSGSETLKHYIQAAFQVGLLPIVGLEMTHKAYLHSKGGWITDESADEACGLALSLGVTHFVLPGTRPDRIERFASGPLKQVRRATIMMPGIGSQGGSIRAAFQAAAPHARFAIIGSAIYEAQYPERALNDFATEMTR